MHDVLHVPSLHSNLFPVSKLMLRDLKMHFYSLGYVVRTRNAEMLAVASLEFIFYQLDVNVMNAVKMSFLAHSNGDSHSLEL